MMEVMEGWARHWESTDAPMKPVLPWRMTFMFIVWIFEEKMSRMKTEKGVHDFMRGRRGQAFGC